MNKLITTSFATSFTYWTNPTRRQQAPRIHISILLQEFAFSTPSPSKARVRAAVSIEVALPYILDKSILLCSPSPPNDSCFAAEQLWLRKNSTANYEGKTNTGNLRIVTTRESKTSERIKAPRVDYQTLKVVHKEDHSQAAYGAFFFVFHHCAKPPDAAMLS